jgi:DNA-binding NarL/FixJ family response regulator
MRVILVGSAEGRARLRAGVEAPLQIVAEFGTVAAARSSAVAFDALLVAPDERDEEVPLMEPLTPREVQVLELRALGLPNRAIAGRLAISDQTVKFHVASIAGKLGARNRTEAVRLAIRRGLVTL